MYSDLYCKNKAIGLAVPILLELFYNKEHIKMCLAYRVYCAKGGIAFVGNKRIYSNM